MADFKAAKVVAAVPTPPEPDTIYLVRRGEGFDLWATNGIGTIVAYPLNADELPTLTIDDITGLEAVLAGKASTTDPRLSDSREWSGDTVPQAEAEAGTASIRRAWTAQRVWQAINAWWQIVTSGFGRNFIAASNEQAARNVLQLGTAATRDVGTAAGNVLEVNAFGIGALGVVSGWTDAKEGLNTGISTALSHGIGLTNLPAGLTSQRTTKFNFGHASYPTTFLAQGGNRLAFFSGSNVDPVNYVLIHHTGNILQATGQSTHFPMSQKAVTDALATKAALNATATQQGGLKARLDGTTLYLTNNGTNP